MTAAGVEPPATTPARVCAIHQPHYLPWLRYLDKLARADVFILLDDAQYNKNGWQNRNRIKGPQGAFTLTVPVRHRYQAQMGEVEIADDRFARAHLAALRSSYGRGPGFDLFYPTLEKLLARPWRRLVDLNREMLPLLLEALEVRTPLRLSSELEAPGTASERLAGLCRAVGATHYLTGAHAAATYLDPEPLDRAGIRLLHHAFASPTYRQLHPASGFVPDLSIVDLIAAEGRGARALLAAAGRVEEAAAPRHRHD